MRDKKHRSGFTFVEVLIAILLVGLAIAALLSANRAFTEANDVGTNLSTAEFLVEQIKELTALLPVVDPDGDNPPVPGVTPFGSDTGETLADYDDLDDFDGANFSPPINANRVSLNDYATFSQRVTVENVSASNFEQVVADHDSSFVRVTVSVYQNSQQITTASWLRARY
jgi:prepilin-type N-terminal cleavage/methylation domain-containing protein